MAGEVSYFDCPSCGHIGLLSQLRDHPIRPCAMDLGFCPECGGEVEEVLSEQEVRALMANYGEDADAEIVRLNAGTPS